MSQKCSELSHALCIEAGQIQPKLQKIKEHIAQGADINFQLEDDGFTPLMLAVDREDEPLVAYLLQQGANPLIKNHHQEIASDIALIYSPIYLLLKNYELLMAAVNNDLPAAKAAIKAGADVNFQGKDGYTALLIASEEGLLELVELLLLNDADTNLARDDGMIPLFLATGELVYETLDYGKPFTEDQKHSLLHREQEDHGRWERWRLKALEARNGQPFEVSQLKFHSYKQPPNQAQIEELQNHIGFPLPHELLEIFASYNGGKPELDHYGEEDTLNISYFYSLDEKTNSPGNIWHAINSYSQNLGPCTLPFAQDYYNDVYFLKWVDGKAQVWIFQYNDRGYDYDEDDYEKGEIPSEKAFLFDSLNEFLEGLYATKA